MFVKLFAILGTILIKCVLFFLIQILLETRLPGWHRNRDSGTSLKRKGVKVTLMEKEKGKDRTMLRSKCRRTLLNQKKEKQVKVSVHIYIRILNDFSWTCQIMEAFKIRIILLSPMPNICDPTPPSPPIPLPLPSLKKPGFHIDGKKPV